MVGIVNTPSILSYARHFDDERMAGSVPVWHTSSEKKMNDVQNVSGTSSFSPYNETGREVVAPTLSFSELLDVINPLHHLPVVGEFYRDLTGDQLSSVARIAGGFLYGGPIGAAASLASAILEENAGNSLANSLLTKSQIQADSFEEDERTAGFNS